MGFVSLIFQFKAIAASDSDSYDKAPHVDAYVIEKHLRGVVDVAVDYEDKGSNINCAFVLLDPAHPYAKPCLQYFCFDPPNPRELQLAFEKTTDAPLGTMTCVFNAPVNINDSVFFSPGIWSPEYKTYPQNSCLFNSATNSYTYPSQTWISGLTQVSSNSNKVFSLFPPEVSSLS